MLDNEKFGFTQQHFPGNTVVICQCPEVNGFGLKHEMPILQMKKLCLRQTGIMSHQTPAHPNALSQHSEKKREIIERFISQQVGNTQLSECASIHMIGIIQIGLFYGKYFNAQISENIKTKTPPKDQNLFKRHTGLVLIWF